MWSLVRRSTYLFGNKGFRAFKNRNAIRGLTGIQPPFAEDLTPLDDDLFGLADFQHYQESPDVKKARLDKESRLMDTELTPSFDLQLSFEDAVTMTKPCVFISNLNDPYLNLAMEQYIYDKLPIDGKNGRPVYPRLMFYTNSPCVVIGKNQNPWKEVNLPLLNLLKLPLLRRNSGGGTVVHDMGNVNFLFMTSKTDFDRFRFAQLVTLAVNKLGEKQLSVNDRGDIVTADGALKVSGSAYKISRGKSYHHGTMLLNLRLDVLKQLLQRDEEARGVVDAMASVASVPSKVANVEITNEQFILTVQQEFIAEFGSSIVSATTSASSSTTSGTIDPDYDEDLDPFALLKDAGFDYSPAATNSQFIGSNGDNVEVITITKETELPSEISTEVDRLRSWAWKFGSTPKFTHKLKLPQRDVEVKFHVGKGALVEQVDITAPDQVVELFKYLTQIVEEDGEVTYTGSNVAGFVLDDEISEWLGEAIDGSS